MSFSTKQKLSSQHFYQTSGDTLILSGTTTVASSTANNGLTKSGNNIHLGGNLTGDTTISALTKTFNIGAYDASVLNDTLHRSTLLRVSPDTIYYQWNKDLQAPSYTNDINNNGYFTVGDGGSFASYITQTNNTGGTTSGSINIANGNFSISASDNTKGLGNDYVIQTFLSPTTGGLSLGGYNNSANGLKSIASGYGAVTNGDYGFAHGVGPTNGSRIVFVSGRAAINMSESTTGQTAGHGALAANSAIIGGINANIPSTAPRSVVLGGKNIKVPASTTDTVFIPNLRVSGGTFLGGLTFTNAPTAWLHLPGSSGAAGRAPLKFNSTNTLMTTPEAGAVEYFNNDKLFFTITTGAARKEFALVDSALTSGRVPIVTTNGRLNDTTGLTFTVGTGLKYGGNYSANYTARSLVDKGFVTGNTISTTGFTLYTGTTAPATYKTKTSFNAYTASTVNVTSSNNGLSKTGNTASLGGALNKYTTYIYNNGSKNNLNNYQSLWFGVSGQTGLPNSGVTTQRNYKPLSDIKFSLSGTNDPSSAFQFNQFSYGGSGLPMTNDTIFSNSGTSINHIEKLNSTDFLYDSFIMIPDQIQFSIGTGKTISVGNVSYSQRAFIQLSDDSFAFGGANGSISYGGGEFNMTGTQGGVTSSLDVASNLITLSPNIASGLGVTLYNTGATFYTPVSFGGISITDSLTPSSRANASGRASLAVGSFVVSSGNFSFAGGQGTSSNKRILATGTTSFNFSANDSSQTAFHGALAAQSFILGGKNHNVPNSALRSGIIGGNAIKASLGVTDTVYLPKLRIGRGTGVSISQLITGSTAILGFTNTTGEVGQVRVTNGLSFNGMLQLGGTITGTTTLTTATGNRLNFAGWPVQYSTDLSANYGARSLVDKGFVTGNTITKSNSTNGHITLTGGTAVVSTTAVTAGSVILVSIDGGTQTNAGDVRVSARSAGSNFTITSSNASDTSQVAWLVI